ncbi:hypothetical protein [Chryseobacterium polytrichastri]|uniref:Uncharacterized protein n=1 Tax=Chryseobacterium polytrichastri TaxID=1302687 RepID=A0A1M7DMT3_9FLAO|nr:hypothetical protein [Chryseobacterium polytrichastri]SHL80824.1 hypothetical protein SAMN05444267_102547 [Chryseobacterium polytrichastri]
MQLFPFSPLGVENILTQLYALSDTDLFIQAEFVKKDFKRWIKDRFILTDHQVSFLEGINEKVSVNYGEQCSFCFTHRLEIKLISLPLPEVPGYAKWIYAENTIAVKADGTGESIISGMLTFTVSYR